MSYTSTALSDMRGDTWRSIRQGLNYTATALAVVGTGVEISKAIQSSAQAAQQARPIPSDAARSYNELAARAAGGDPGALQVVAKPFSRDVSFIPGKGLNHKGWAWGDGTFMKEMGPGAGNEIRLNFYTDFANKLGNVGAEKTYIETLNAFKQGAITYGPERATTWRAIAESVDNYNAVFVETGRIYNPAYENSNYAANWLGTHSGLGNADGVGFAPGGFYDPRDN